MRYVFARVLHGYLFINASPIISFVHTCKQNFSFQSTEELDPETAGNTLSGQVGEMGGTSPASSDGSLAPSAAGGDSQSVSGAGNQQGGAQGNNASGNSTAGVSAERLLNSANLKPMRTNCTALDRKVDQIFAQILNSGMSTYQKVKACFDYLVKNGIYSYDHRVEDPTQGILYNSSLDANIVQLAYSMLTTNRGVCDDYSAAFLVMTRAIGLESYLVTGQVRSKSGGYTGHTWVNIRLSGTYYIFDPQVQQDNAGAPYSYFCKTDAQMGDTYRYNDRAGMIAQFNSFRHSTEISATITVRSGGKTYQASLSQSNAANGGAVFPEGVSVGGDGTFSIDIAPSGGDGQYLCQIGYFWQPGYYAEKTISGRESFTIRADRGTNTIQVAVQSSSADPSQNAVIFEFPVTYMG